MKDEIISHWFLGCMLAFISVNTITGNLAIDVSECGKTKGCLRQPGSCSAQNCKKIFTWREDQQNKVVYFELGGLPTDDPPWLAVGFSDTSLMPMTSVVDCIVDPSKGGKIVIQSSFNPDHYNEVLSPPSTGLIPNASEGSFVDGFLTCKFAKPLTFNGSSEMGLKVANFSRDYYFLIAEGKTNSEGVKSMHSSMPISSPNKINVSDNIDVKDTSRLTAQIGLTIDVSECGNKKGCMRRPQLCQSDGCINIFTWKVDKAKGIVDFELGGQTTGSFPWLAVGFSNNTKMPGTSVVDCIVNPSTKNITIQASYNPDHYNQVLSPKEIGLIPNKNAASFVDGFLTCKFSKPLVLNVSERVRYKLANLHKAYYLFLASGDTKSDGEKGKHTNNPIVSPMKILVTDNLNVHVGGLANEAKAMATHATLMILAWMLFASIGVVTARYHKTVWAQKVCGNKLWFQIHRGMIILLFLCTAAALTVIFIQKKLEPLKQKELHPILGLTVCSIMILNIILGLFRPSPGTSSRPIFNWAHSLAGNGATLLAVPTMFFGVETFSDEVYLMNWCKWLVVAFGGWRVLCELIMIIHKYYNKEDLKIAYVEMSGAGEDVHVEKQVVMFKTAMFIVYICGVISLVIALLYALLYPMTNKQ